MTTANVFRTAVENRDLRGMVETLADDVLFHSPAKFSPFEGKTAVGALLQVLMQHVFEEFRYTDDLESADGLHGLVFQARVGERQVQGIDLLRFDDSGKIREFTVMLRPRSGLDAVMNAVNDKLGLVAGND